MKLIAQGRAVEGFKDAVSRAKGSGTTIIEVDLPHRLEIPFFPDLPIGGALGQSLSVLDASILVIPGVHLVSPSTYTASGGTGTLRVLLRTNPLPLIPIAVAVAILAFLGLAGVIGWRIFHADPVEFTVILVIIGVLAALTVFLIFSPPGKIAATVQSLKGG